MPLICPFLLYLAAVSNCDFWVIPSWVYTSRSSPAWSFFRFHSASLSLAPSFPPTSVAFKKPSSGATAFSFASKTASYLLSAWACHVIPSFSSTLTSFLRSFLHLRHLVYKLNRLYSFLAPPAFRSFYHPYSGQICPYCSVSYLDLGVARGVFFRGVSEYRIDFSFCPGDVKTTAADFSFLHFHLVPLSKLPRPCLSHVFLDVCKWTPAFNLFSSSFRSISCC